MERDRSPDIARPKRIYDDEYVRAPDREFDDRRVGRPDDLATDKKRKFEDPAALRGRWTAWIVKNRDCHQTRSFENVYIADCLIDSLFQVLSMMELMVQFVMVCQCRP